MTDSENRHQSAQNRQNTPKFVSPKVNSSPSNVPLEKDTTTNTAANNNNNNNTHQNNRHTTSSTVSPPTASPTLENGTTVDEEGFDDALTLDSSVTQNSKITSIFSRIYNPIVSSLTGWNQSTPSANGQDFPQSITPVTSNTPSPIPTAKSPSMLKRKSQKLPGTAKLVVGAQYPPRYEPPLDEPKHIPTASTSHKEKAETISNSHIENIPISPFTSQMTIETKTESNTPISPSATATTPTSSPINNPNNNTQINKENEKEERKINSMTFNQESKIAKFRKVLMQPNVDLEALKKISWSGVIKDMRSSVWQLLLGYLPTNSERREATLSRKRKEYIDCIPQYFDISDNERTEYEIKVIRQIRLDTPRTAPSAPLFHQEVAQKILERILYIWSIRHPASGYVQGINDLVIPFLYVFLQDFIHDEDILNYDLNQLTADKLQIVEADSYWCLTKFLDNIQDMYTISQPGIQRMVFKLKELVQRLDSALYQHLQNLEVIFIQFAFRWMNCLLMRELPLPLVIRMWDTYLAEGDLAVFHVYTCAAFLLRWTEELRARDFHGIMMFLQNCPTQNWTDKDMDMLLAQAYQWKTLFHESPSHLKTN